MPSSYSSLLRLELVATGEKSSLWGDITNLTLGTLLEAAIAGTVTIPLAGTSHTLTTVNGAADQARYAVLSFTGAPGGTATITIPAVSKKYLAANGTNQIVQLKTAGGLAAQVPAGTVAWVWCNGTDSWLASTPVVPTTGMPTTLTLTGAATIQGGLTVTVPGTGPALAATAGTSAFAIDVRGRSADGIGIVRFLNNAGTTELARLQSGAGVGTIALSLDGGTKGVFSTDTTGNITFTKGATITDGLTINGTNGLLVANGGGVFNGDLAAKRTATAPTTGAIFLGNTGTRYLFWDGTAYQLGGANCELQQNGRTFWHSGNLTPANYAPLAGAVFTGNVTVPALIVKANAANRLIYFRHNDDSEAGTLWHDHATNRMYLRTAGLGTVYLDSSGNVIASGNVGANSDARLKEHIDALAAGTAAELVRGLGRAVACYRWKRGHGDGGRRDQLGFIAQKVAPLLPQAVLAQDTGDDTGSHILAVQDRPILAAVTAALAEALDRIAALEAAAAQAAP